MRPMADDDRPLILVDPWPRTLERICDAATRARLEALGRVVVHEDGRMPAEMVERHLPEAVAIVGQTDLNSGRLARAPRLRAILNVEGNLLPNVDYAACFARGIHALVASPAFAPAVAETALGRALDLARGISAADRAMRAGAERYQLEGNRDAFLLHGATVGLVGFGDLARALLELLAPFGCRVLAHDPWLPDLVVGANRGISRRKCVRISVMEHAVRRGEWHRQAVRNGPGLYQRLEVETPRQKRSVGIGQKTLCHVRSNALRRTRTGRRARVIGPAMTASQTGPQVATQGTRETSASHDAT
jgi:hypothetical protein